MNGGTSKHSIKPIKPSPSSINKKPNMYIPAKEENIFKTKCLLSDSKNKHKDNKTQKSNVSNTSTNMPSTICTSFIEEKEKYNYNTNSDNNSKNTSGNKNCDLRSKNGLSPNKKLQRNNSCIMETERVSGRYFERMENRSKKNMEKERNDHSCTSDKSFTNIMLSRDSILNNSNIDFSFEKPKNDYLDSHRTKTNQSKFMT